MQSNIALLPWQKLILVSGKMLFSVLLAVQLAAVTWQIAAPEPLVLMAPSQQAKNTNSSSQTLNTAQYHLFGVAGTEPLTKVNAEVSAPETKLRLELLGVTVSLANKDASSAIIAPKGSTGEFYRVGDTVQGGTRLAAVYDNRVILDSNGKLETLKFDLLSKEGLETKRIEAPAAPKQSSLRDRFRDVKTPTDFMNVVTDEANSDPAGALSQLGLEAIGPGQGYRVQPGSMLLAVELQPGDVVLSINGQSLGDLQADQQLLQQVASEGRARIEVQRGNNRFVVNHSLN